MFGIYFGSTDFLECFVEIVQGFYEIPSKKLVSKSNTPHPWPSKKNKKSFIFPTSYSKFYKQNKENFQWKTRIRKNQIKFIIFMGFELRECGNVRLVEFDPSNFIHNLLETIKSKFPLIKIFMIFTLNTKKKNRLKFSLENLLKI